MVSIDEVINQFKEINHVVLATVDADKPRLRPMTLVKLDSELYFATGSDANKVKQLEMNQQVELILQWKEEQNNGYICVQGKAIRETKKTR